MAFASRNKIYLLIIGILLLTNIGLLGYISFYNPRKNVFKHSQKPGSFLEESLKNEVGFNEDQMNQFRQLEKQHRESIVPLFEAISNAKLNLYKQITDGPASDSSIQAAAAEIAEKQKAIDLKIFHHFQDIRKLSTPEQRQKLDTLLQKVTNKFVFHKPGHRPDSANIREK